MSEEEKEVLKTFKSGLGLTGAEREILVNYIDKLQKEKEEYHRIKKDLIRANKKIYDVDTIDEFIKTIDKLQTKYEKQKRINLEENQFIDTQKTNIIKLQKVIDLMAESWKQDDIRSVEQIKEYFYKKVEEENE